MEIYGKCNNKIRVEQPTAWQSGVRSRKKKIRFVLEHLFSVFTFSVSELEININCNYIWGRL